MIPLSPILYLTAVKAAAVPGSTARDAESCAVHFVDQMGVVSHQKEPGHSSSWPLQGVRTVAELRQRAMGEGMLRLVPRAGDLVIPTERYGLPVAVVLKVIEYGVGPMGRSAKCHVVFATPGEHGAVVREMEMWFATGRGDLFVRWHRLAPRPLPVAVWRAA